MRSFRPAVSLVCLVLILIGGVQRSAAETFEYDGLFTLCIATCDSFAALGGPGGAANLQPSVVSGTIEINVGPSSSFTSADVGTIAFEVFNANEPTDPAQFDGSGNLLNPTTANPLPLSNAVAAVTGSGTTDASGNLVSGNLDVAFTVPPFSSNGAVIYFDLTTGDAEGFLFVNIQKFIEIAGSFALQVPPGAISVAPTAVDFGDVSQGDPTATQTVTVTSGGPNPLIISQVDTTNIAPPLAVDASACDGMTLAAAATCDIVVTLDTANLGAANGSFDIVSNDPGTPTQVSVTGNVIVPPAPSIAFNPADVAFPTTIVGQISESIVTVTNGGNADLIVGMVNSTGSLAAPFSLVADTCSSTTVLPAGTCTLTLQFAPAAGGMAGGSFDVPSNDADGPDTITLSGEGTVLVEPEIQALPAAIAFGEVLLGQFVTSSVTLTNVGTGVLNFASFDVTGPGFSLDSNTCGATLAVQASCVATVLLNASTGGGLMGALTVVSDAATDPNLMIPITATVFEGPRINVTPATLDIGSMAVPIELDQTAGGQIVVGNDGASALTVTAISLATSGGMSPTEFSVTETCTAAPVAVGATCTIDVGFAPVTPGDKTTAVIINSDDPDTSTLQVPVTGFVLLGARAATTPDPFVIGSASDTTEVDMTRSTPLTVTSNGTDDLIVSAISISGANADEFTFVDDCTAGPVARGSICMITVTFAPSTAGERTAVIEISANAMGLMVNVSGFGAFPPPPPPPPAPGSQINTPPAFSLGDTGSEGGCFIATAAYGSYLDPNVKVLRDFRDDVLLRTAWGSRLVSVYYRTSPPIADTIAQNEALRTLVRLMLTPLVTALAYPLSAVTLLLAAWFGLRYRRAVLWERHPPKSLPQIATTGRRSDTLGRSARQSGT